MDCMGGFSQNGWFDFEIQNRFGSEILIFLLFTK